MNRGRFRGNRGGRFPKNGGGGGGGSGGAGFIEGGGVVRLKGLFEKGVWHCDCEPRLPAQHFKVRKEGKNQGRWFYTCQKQQPDRCGFFLWDEEAEPRMESAVLNNSTSEVLIPPRPAISSNLPAPRETEQRLQITAQTRTPVTTPKKRKLPWLDYDTEDSDAEVYPWQLTGEEELALSQATDAAVADSRDKLGSRKAVKHDDFSRPGGASTTNIVSLMANGLVTPGTTPQKMVIKREVVEPETPTPLRFSDVAIKREMSSEERSLAPSRSSETPGASDKNGGGNLTAQVFGILRSAGVELRADSAGPLKAVLERHVLRQLGAERGREMVRAGLKSREATIVHQAQRIMALETELEACKALVKCLRGG